MTNGDAAVLALIGISALGFLLADGERQRLKWVQAMRRCLLRFGDAIRYEQLPLQRLLCSIDLRATQQEKLLSRLLQKCAGRIEEEKEMSLGKAFEMEGAGIPGFGVLSRQDKAPFEAMLEELGRYSLHEQLRLISDADERLRVREEVLRHETVRRAKLTASLGMCCGAAVFLMLI